MSEFLIGVLFSVFLQSCFVFSVWLFTPLNKEPNKRAASIDNTMRAKTNAR